MHGKILLPMMILSSMQSSKWKSHPWFLQCVGDEWRVCLCFSWWPSLHLKCAWGCLYLWAENYGLQEWPKLPHQEKSAMKCLCKFSKWFLPQEETSGNVAIMVCPWYLLQDKTYTMGENHAPNGMYIQYSPNNSPRKCINIRNTMEQYAIKTSCQMTTGEWFQIPLMEPMQCLLGLPQNQK